MRIALLAFGSLLWKPSPAFDAQHDDWRPDGPTLPLEFMNFARGRAHEIALVIDVASGAPCRVAWAESRRARLDDAIDDLRQREGCASEEIGFVRVDGSAARGRERSVIDVVAAWSRVRRVDATIWTDMAPNFEQAFDEPFSVAAAVARVRAMAPGPKAGVAEYVWRSPRFVATPLRAALQPPPWF